jgi:RNA ligase
VFFYAEIIMETLLKYPRTPHIQGSRCQTGDENLANEPFTVIADRFLVIEEKVDGANAAMSFDPQGQLLLQSRGHYLTGGSRERHFNLFKQWAFSHQAAFWQVLKDRYILYGEWMYAKHTVFYDWLPHYFLEYDLFDRQQQIFLSTAARQQVLSGLPLCSVPILYRGELQKYAQLTKLLDRSHFIRAGHLDRLRASCVEQQIDPDLAIAQTNPSELMEGLYIKVETAAQTVARYKFVRPDFLNTILDSGTHWLNRPIIPNQLQPQVNLF